MLAKIFDTGSGWPQKGAYLWDGHALVQVLDLGCSVSQEPLGHPSVYADVRAASWDDLEGDEDPLDCIFTLGLTASD